ncbi:MAG: SDR family oxidoreductase [Rhodospirillaceae bacterium]|nr:SDR family oxidoreductase [Rhodospirillaceae bacterium]
MKGIKGKVAIIPGGATKIGEAAVERFIKEGAKVAIADINAEAGAALVKKYGDNAMFVETDLRDDASIDALVSAVKGAWGRIDFLINVACTYVDEGIASPRADWLEAFNVNVVGSVVLMQKTKDELAKNKGAIVNFASISAHVAQTGRWLYPVCKAAIVQLTRNQAVDLAPDGVRVNCVSPGWTWSNIIEELSGGNRAKADGVAGSFHALGRCGDAEEVANAVLFLCSDEASFITGTDLAVDGGYGAMGPEQNKPAIPLLME